MRVLIAFACSIGLLSFPINAAEDWLSEEVLQQLHELRSDIRGLRENVSSLKDEVSDLKAELPRYGDRVVTVKSRGPERMTVGKAPILGNKNAKVAVIEFTDFECPFCSRHHKQTFMKLKEHYIETGKIQYIAKDYPLGLHKNAMSAAVAARCAGEQGKYWEMHHSLFENQRRLSEAFFYKEEARNQGLDITKFSACLDSAEQKKRVNMDYVEGEKIGVRGTPAFFIGRIDSGVVTDIQPLKGAQAYERFRQIIDSLLN